jgi:hypothetical protein
MRVGVEGRKQQVWETVRAHRSRRDLIFCGKHSGCRDGQGHKLDPEDYYYCCEPNPDRLMHVIARGARVGTTAHSTRHRMGPPSPNNKHDAVREYYCSACNNGLYIAYCINEGAALCYNRNHA